MRGKRKQKNFSGFAAHLLKCGAFFCAGTLLGIFCEKFVSAQAHEQLAAYIRNYATVASEKIVESSVLAVLLGYLRYPVLMFAIGYLSGGTLLLLLLFTVQGFSMSFAVQCIIDSIEQQGVLVSLGLLGIRSFFVLPCTLYLAGAVLDKVEQRRPYTTSDYFIFGVCLSLLLLGAFLDLAITPRLLHRILF